MSRILSLLCLFPVAPQLLQMFKVSRLDASDVLPAEDATFELDWGMGW